MTTHKRFTQNQIDDFRSRLLDRRTHLLKLEKALEKEALQELSADSTGEISRVHQHPADVGSESYNQELTLRLAENEIREVKEIEAALTRIEKSQFGECESCGEEIPIHRLEAVPEARLCIECKEDLEHEAEVRYKLNHPRETKPLMN